MSTKTTFKRIALVAVAALGLGVLSTVAPANAAGRTAASIVVGDIPSVRVGGTAYVPVKIYLPAGSVATDTITITAQITAAPIMGGAANAASGLNAASSSASNNSGAQLALVTDAIGTAYSSGIEHGRTTSASDNTIIDGGSGTPASLIDEYALVAADITAGYHTTYVKIVPDVSGSYSVLVSTNATGVNGYTAGDANASFTIATGGAPTGVTIRNLDASSLVTSMANGIAVEVALVGGSLAGLESISLTTAGSISKGASASAVTPNTFSTAGTAVALTAADFINGKKIVWLKDAAATAARTISLTATGSSGVSSNVTATKTYSTSVGLGSTTLAYTVQAPNVANTATTFYAMTNAVEGTETSHSADITVTELSTSQKVGFTLPTAMVEQYGYITLTDNAGTITGVSSLVTDRPTSSAVTTAVSGGSFAFAASGVGLPAGTTLFTVLMPQASTTVYGHITQAKTRVFKTAARTNSTFTVTPGSTILAAPAAAVALTATLKDQFGVARSNVSVTITTSGRNNPAATTATTDATGLVTFTTADASTSTTALTDTVTFAASGATSSAVTINYANTAVGTVTVTGGNTTASVNALVNDPKPISVGSSTTGAEAGAITITATVKDALGNALAGVPVSFTVAGTGVAFTSTSATKYTAADGTAAGSLYAWTAGTYTYTVTAGGKTTTGTATFASTTAGNARVISATVAGNVVTGKAVDRFGNPVQNAVLYASTSGAANIGGLFIKDGTTAADGTVSWVVTGSGEVTVSAVNPTSVAGTTAYQTSHLAGNATLASATVAAVAYGATVAGTATTAETNVGATFAPAGVASAKVSVDTADTAQAAADAAAEATDAANAATDAANAAAEAADAATAAAQDAADAVAALSTQVTELVSALRKQITSLTNLVIKIQRKVRA
jgi:trimeric autotransporter adhesin